MGAIRRDLNELLVDLHLDRVSDEDRAWLENQLQRDPGLRKTSDRLGRLLQPLDHWNVAPPPSNLTEKVLARIHEHYLRSPAKAGTPSWRETGRTYRLIPFPRMRNIAAVAACLLLMAGVFIPGLSELRYRSRRFACANNLGSIYRGLSAYQESFAGALPFAGGRDGASWLPESSNGAPYESNGRHPYLLVKLNFGPQTKDFVCPSDRRAVVMDPERLAHQDDFALARNVSYDSRNLSGRSPILRPAKTTAYLGDRNPLFVNARFNAGIDPSTTNSPAHRRRGQTLLMLDGQVRFLKTPAYGPDHDNPWILGNLRSYTGTEKDTSAEDAFLVPGYPAGDPEVSQHLKQ